MLLLQLDIRTLLLVSSISYGQLALIAVITWRAYPQEECARDWAIGASVGCASVLLLGLRGLIPDFISIVVANAGLVLGQICVYLGNCRYLGRPLGPRWLWGGAMLLTVALFSLFTFIFPSLVTRTISISLVIALVSGLSTWQFWRFHEPGLQAARALALLAFSFLGVAGLLRAASAPWVETEASLLQSDPLFALFLLGQTLALGSLSVTFVMLITGRLQVRLSESEQHYRSLFETMPVGVFFHDQAGVITSVNSSAIQLLGVPAEALVGCTTMALPWEAVQADGTPLPAEAYPVSVALATGRAVRHVLLGVRRGDSGERVWLSVNATPFIRPGEAQPSQVYSTFEDITARRLAEAALRESEALYRSIIENIVDIFYRTDRQGQLTLVSPSAVGMLGYESVAELVGMQAEAFWYYPEERQALLSRLPAGPVRDLETAIRKKDGTALPVSMSCHYYVDAAGRLAGVEGILRDITERKRAQDALQAERAQLAERVEARTAELRALNADLTRAVRSRDEFLAAISHELRTPLTAVLGLAELLQWQLSGPLNETQLKQVKDIYRSGQQLLQLINDVLDMAKVISGRLELEMTLLQPEEVCQASLRAVQVKVQQKGLTIRYTSDPAVTMVLADRRRLQQILVNLLENAVKFTPRGGQLGLEVQGFRDRQEVQFKVWDTGIGIDPKDLPRLFQHFVQLDSRLARNYEGAGLGLALVKRLAEMHAGTVDATSEGLGRGSRFTVTLPWPAMEQALARVTVTG
jgi:PAS domain S-box-containing protein